MPRWTDGQRICLVGGVRYVAMDMVRDEGLLNGLTFPDDVAVLTRAGSTSARQSTSPTARLRGMRMPLRPGKSGPIRSRAWSATPTLEWIRSSIREGVGNIDELNLMRIEQVFRWTDGLRIGLVGGVRSITMDVVRDEELLNGPGLP